MILSRFSFPCFPSALCTVFGERGLPCPVTLLGSSLSPCPVSSPPSLFFLPWGALGGGGVCCCREGVGEGAGEGEWEWVRLSLPPPSHKGRLLDPLSQCVRVAGVGQEARGSGRFDAPRVILGSLGYMQDPLSHK